MTDRGGRAAVAEVEVRKEKEKKVIMVAGGWGGSNNATGRRPWLYDAKEKGREMDKRKVKKKEKTDG